VLAVAVAGFTGWPPTRAIAATFEKPDSDAVMLGVDESTAVAIGPKVSIGDKFEATPTTLTAEANARLTAPSAKRAAKAAAKRGERESARKTAKRSPVRESVKKSSQAKKTTLKDAAGAAWRKARASWYGPGFYGNGMAGGGKLKRDSMVVAHRSLPFGTRIKVKYNGRSVIAVVKDRGPYVGGRTFDLGPGTAKALGFSGVGTIRYKVLR